MLTACGDNCESHEICIQAYPYPYPECKGENVYLSIFLSLKFEEIDRSRLEESSAIRSCPAIAHVPTTRKSSHIITIFSVRMVTLAIISSQH